MTPQPVARVETAHRRIVTPLPVPESVPVLQDLERSSYDVVVIDEAHHCAEVGGSDDRDASLRRRLAEVYHTQLSEAYARPEPVAAELRAATLNTRALSLLDLGKRKTSASRMAVTARAGKMKRGDL